MINPLYKIPSASVNFLQTVKDYRCYKRTFKNACIVFNIKKQKYDIAFYSEKFINARLTTYQFVTNKEI